MWASTYSIEHIEQGTKEDFKVNVLFGDRRNTDLHRTHTRGGIRVIGWPNINKVYLPLSYFVYFSCPLHAVCSLCRQLEKKPRGR